MKKILFLAAVTALIGGCSSPHLYNGLYTNRNGSDFAAVFNDQIVIQLPRPAMVPGNTNAWIWGGNYKLEKNGEITLDMSEKERKDWRFYYNLNYDENGSINVEVLGNPDKSFVLRKQAVQPRATRKLEPMD
ncbi:MAG: hypothetical protein PHI35_03685 [Victivallaceae bacterium]|nr:hypothetical protein [Victivallaceae bacterium]